MLLLAHSPFCAFLLGFLFVESQIHRAAHDLLTSANKCEGRERHVECVHDVTIGFCCEAKLVVVVLKIL